MRDDDLLDETDETVIWRFLAGRLKICKSKLMACFYFGSCAKVNTNLLAQNSLAQNS